MEIDKAPLNEAKERLEESIKSVQEAYECEWDDPVHESYGAYIEDTKSMAEKICTAIDEISSSANQIIATNADALNERVSSLESSLRYI